jgi:hypothetical protein
MGIVELSRLVAHRRKEVLRVLWGTVIRVDRVEIVLRVEIQTMLLVEVVVLVARVVTLKLELMGVEQMVEVMVGSEYPFQVHLVEHTGKVGMSGVGGVVIFINLVQIVKVVVG